MTSDWDSEISKKKKKSLWYERVVDARTA
jgi:hypothetical protein